MKIHKWFIKISLTLEADSTCGERNSNPLQYSCLGISIDRGAWPGTVHGVVRVRYNLVTTLPLIDKNFSYNCLLLTRVYTDYPGMMKIRQANERTTLNDRRALDLTHFSRLSQKCTISLHWADFVTFSLP